MRLSIYVHKEILLDPINVVLMLVEIHAYTTCKPTYVYFNSHYTVYYVQCLPLRTKKEGRVL